MTIDIVPFYRLKDFFTKILGSSISVAIDNVSQYTRISPSIGSRLYACPPYFLHSSSRHICCSMAACNVRQLIPTHASKNLQTVLCHSRHVAIVTFHAILHACVRANPSYTNCQFLPA